jgi:hypothetical protein
VIRTKKGIANLEAHQAGVPSEDAGSVAVAGVLARLDRCGKSIQLRRLRALPVACMVCE